MTRTSTSTLLHIPHPTKRQSVVHSADHKVPIQINENIKPRQKELALGKSKSNIARRMAQWAEPAIIIDDKSSVATDKQQVSNININEQDSNKFLTQPLLDGGQGKANGNDNHTLLQPRGDINHGTHNQHTECQQLLHKRDTLVARQSNRCKSDKLGVARRTTMSHIHPKGQLQRPWGMEKL